MKQRILGLDTGTNSLGWAVVDRNEDSTYTLVQNGVLIFPEGVKSEKGKESSKAAERTGHRALRKHYFRRRLRKIETLKVLVKYGLCPRLSDEELHEWHVHKRYPMNEEFLQWQRTNENERKNPYYYRHRCLHETLDMESPRDRYVLGRALYHLVQRRGFLSNRLDASEDDNKDTGKVKTGISGLSAEMKEAGFEYLGDYFYWLYTENGNRVRIRERYTDREKHYEEEFRAICKRQRLPEELVEALHRAMYFQRPLKSQKHNVGKCKFESGKRRCVESHPDYEEFRMLQVLNNIQIQTPRDEALRPLTAEEREKILPKFFRVSKSNFDFEDLAKELAGKNNYAYYKDTETAKPYLFNYRMTQGISGCPTTACLRNIWGENWQEALAETYTRNRAGAGEKTLADMVTDVWNVLYSFSSQSKLKTFAIEKLQLSEEEAEKFSKIKVGRGTASVSLRAVRKMLPFLREGIIYPHAVFLANIPAVVTSDVWNDERQRAFILEEVRRLLDSNEVRGSGMVGTLEKCIKDFLKDNFDLNPGAAEKLYHPSMIETYSAARPNKDGILQLGSPATSSVRNPMAMRSLHQVRHLVNQLLKERIIDRDTEIHVEYARELSDANLRKAQADYNKQQKDKRDKAREELQKLYKEETGREITPTERDIEKYLLWEEQGKICLYTGARIGVAEFAGNDPKFDIEHTIPRSRGGDSTMMNKTLCAGRFNRQVKGTKLPSELNEHKEILERIAGWKKTADDLKRQMDRLRTNPSMAKDKKDGIIQKRHLLRIQHDYWWNKYNRFLMTEVPEGFSRRQGAGIGLISRYAGLFLQSLFPHVYAVKGQTTDEFRRMWGLQEAYAAKSRDNHVHHCIDAVVIACIGKREYDGMARFYRDEEAHEAGRGSKPQYSKPWSTFTADVLRLGEKILVPHAMPDVFGKKAGKPVYVKGQKYKAQGDSARGCLHQDTYYGAILRDGEPKFVVRKSLAKLEKSDVKHIVDDAVRRIVEDEVECKGFKAAMAGDVYMNREKGIRIKKVRVFCPNVTRPLDIRRHRDVSPKEYKRTYHVANDTNYAMAIYEGEAKGKVKRDFELVNNLDAARFYKRSMDRDDYPALVPVASKNGFPLRCLLRSGTMVLLWEKNPEEIWELDRKELRNRLYKVVGLSSLLVQDKYLYGTVTLRFHQEARPTTDLKVKNGLYKQGEPYRPLIGLLHTQFNALVEGVDFEITVLGEIRPLRRN